MGHITYNPGAVVRYKNRLRMVYGNDTYMRDVQNPAVTVLGFPASRPQLLESRIAVGGEMLLAQSRRYLVLVSHLNAGIDHRNEISSPALMVSLYGQAALRFPKIVRCPLRWITP